MDALEFRKHAMKAGFSAEQAEFLQKHVAQRPHTHTAVEIIVDPGDGETLEHFIDELVATEVFEDGAVLHAGDTEEEESEEEETEEAGS